MHHFVSHVFSFISHLGILDKMHSQLMDSVGKDFNSSHKFVEKKLDDLMNQPQHIDKVLNKQCQTEIVNNRLQLKVSIDVVRVLALQGIAFRGRDESSTSVNRENFIEILDVVASYDKKKKLLK